MLSQQNRFKHQAPPRLKQQKGVVIVVALFIVALVATMAYTMLARLERDVRRTTLILRDAEAENLAQGSIAWAIDQLKTNIEQQKKDQLVDVTPIVSPIEEVNGFQIKSTIFDVEGRFNLNNLLNVESQKDFKRLLRLVNPKLTEENAQLIMQATVDWITPAAQQNAFTKYYTELPVPYRAAHRAMLSATELRLVKGMTTDLYASLQPYIIALPGTTPVNVQTAQAPVFAALSESMTVESGEELERMRKDAPFVTPQYFLNLVFIKNHPIPENKITTVSSYFLLETDVSIERQHLLIYTLLERSTKDKKANIKIRWQSKNTW